MTRNVLKLIAVTFSLVLSAPVTFASEKALYFIDAHSQMDRDVSQETIIKLMNNNGVYRTILASRRGRKPKEILNFAKTYPERIIPSLAKAVGLYFRIHKAP